MASTEAMPVEPLSTSPPPSGETLETSPTPPPETETLETPPPTDVSDEKPVLEAEQQPLDVVEKIPDSSSEEKPVEEKPLECPVSRDIELERVVSEKKILLITAWEENEKCKADNKAHKKIAALEAWENSKKAACEAELKIIEENLEKKKKEYAEKMKNKLAIIHKEAEEKKAIIEAKRGEYVVKVEEIATKYRAMGKPPKKILGLF